MARFRSSVFSSLLCVTLVSGALVTYNSRPDIESPVFDIIIHNSSKITPGYIFLTPHADISSPMIFDTLGNLVWSGVDVIGSSSATDLHPCSLNGDTSHLCVYSGQFGTEFWRGQGVILDSTFRTAQAVYSGNGRVSSDGHEFNVLPDGKSALITIYQPVQYDMSAYNITKTQGWIMDGIVQEIAIESGEVLFEWRALDYVDPTSCYVTPGADSGTTADSAWQYFHINAVDKDPDGNYLVSSRYCSTIYYVSATNGSIIWSLNGVDPQRSNWTLEGFGFSFQHDVRFISRNQTSTIISIFDNNSIGGTSSAPQSEGMIIELSIPATKSVTDSHIIGTASVVAAYQAPQSHGLQSFSQGNLQVLPEGNVLIGWGSSPFISEYLADGTPVYFVNFGSGMGVSSYRAYKGNFTGNPLSSPATYSYALNTSVATTHYVSWNGCTECAAWNFYEGACQTGPFTLASTSPIVKTGFETNFTGTVFAAYVYAEALDAGGNVLSKSQVGKTFVPGKILAGSCNDIQCPVTPSSPSCNCLT